MKKTKYTSSQKYTSSHKSSLVSVDIGTKARKSGRVAAVGIATGSHKGQGSLVSVDVLGGKRGSLASVNVGGKSNYHKALVQVDVATSRKSKSSHRSHGRSGYSNHGSLVKVAALNNRGSALKVSALDGGKKARGSLVKVSALKNHGSLVKVSALNGGTKARNNGIRVGAKLLNSGKRAGSLIKTSGADCTPAASSRGKGRSAINVAALSARSALKVRVK